VDKRWLTLFTMLREFAILWISWVEDEILDVPCDRSALAKKREKYLMARFNK
jgi:hypothetical protein